jgi:aryl-alcohol dehydrogenase-like predicted oxidoreductase
VERRNLGRTGLVASVLGFGCNRIVASRAPDDRREVEATLLEAIDRGVNLYDTSNGYAAGEAEVLLGRILRPHRSAVLLCSKVGAKHWSSVLLERWADQVRFALRARWRRESRGSGGGSPAARANRSVRSFAPRFIELGVAGSLRRLGTDHLDVLYLHGPPGSVLADERVFAKLEDLQRRGWTRCYGVSFTAATSTHEIVETVERWPGIAIVQVLIHPLAAIDLARLVAVTRAHGVAIAARQTLDKGALLARADLAAVDAAHPGRTRAQALLRYAAQCDGVDTVLVGMRSRAHLLENASAFDGAPATGSSFPVASEARVKRR